MYATLTYLPPARLNRDAFLRNLLAFKHEYPIIFYSDEPQPGLDVVPIPDPTSIKRSQNRVSIHNYVYLQGLKIAQDRGLKRFLYVESDSRAGHDYWDKRIFDEAEPYKDMFAAGTPSIYQEKSMQTPQLNSVLLAANRYKAATGFSVPMFNAKKPRPLGAWFIMGSCAVYPVAISADIMMGFERDMHQKAIKTPAFDLFIGLRCLQLFGAKAVQKLPFLTSVFSTFGNKINTEQDRIEMVKSGRYSLVHQIKSNESCVD